MSLADIEQNKPKLLDLLRRIEPTARGRFLSATEGTHTLLIEFNQRAEAVALDEDWLDEFETGWRAQVELTLRETLAKMRKDP